MDQMSADQLYGWMQYYTLEPFGEERADLRAGVVASTIANVNRNPKKGKPFRPQDFVLKFGNEGQDGGGSGSGARKPLRDPAEWQRAKGMAKVMAQAMAEANNRKRLREG